MGQQESSKPAGGSGSNGARRTVGTRLKSRVVGKNVGKKIAWCWRIGLGLPIVVGATVMVVAVGFPNRFVLPVVSKVVGLDISADRLLLINTDLDIIAEGVRVRVPGIEGPAGELARAERVEASYDWSALFSGGRFIDRVTLTAPVVRISQDIDTGDLNLELLPRRRAGGAGLPPLPEIEIIEATTLSGAFERETQVAALEVGEHRGSTWTRLWRVPVSGALRPGDTPGVYDVMLEGVTDAASDQRVSIVGATGIGGTRLEITDVGLAIDPERVPSRARDLFAAFQLDGTIPKVVFDQPAGGNPMVVVELDSVGMNLPFWPDRPDAIRLQRTSGQLRLVDGRFEAEVKGFASDVPYDVSFRTGQIDTQSIPELPFDLTASITDYLLPPDPPVVPFLPEVVQNRFRQFTSPTGRVSAEARISRKKPGGTVDFEGEVDVTDGRAAYFRFPYVFEDITAHVTFSNQEVRIESLEGRAKSGATIAMDAMFSPLDGTSEVDLNIDVRGVPADDSAREALSSDYQLVYDALMSKSGYDDLVEAGMIRRSPSEPGGAPVFEMGGEIEIDIRLHRELGEVSVWTREFAIRTDKANLVPEWYRAPLAAEDVEVRLTETTIETITGSFENLLGGTGSAQGTALLEHPETGEVAFLPDITISARDVPVGPSMVVGLEDVAEGGASEIIEGMGLAGRTSGSVRLTTTDELAFGLDIEASLDGVTSVTGDEGRSLEVAAQEGSVRITLDGLDARASGLASGTSRGGETTTSPFEAGAIVRWNGPEAGRYEQDVYASDADATWPIEPLIGVFSPAVARSVSDVRAQHSPTGRAALDFRYASDGDAAQLTAAVSGVRGLGAFLPADIGCGMLTLPQAEGVARVTWTSEPGSLRLGFDAFDAVLSYDEEPVGRFRLDGGLAFGDRRAVASTDGSDGLSFEVSSWRIGTRAMESLADRISDALAERYDEFRPDGFVSASGVVTRDDQGRWEPRGEIELEALSLLRGGGRRVHLDDVEGAIRFEPGVLLLESVHAVGDGFVPAVDGSLRFDDGVVGDFVLELWADDVSEDLRLLVPKAVGDGMEAIALGTDGSIVLPDVRLQFEANERGASFQVSGNATVEDARMKSGLEFTGVDGEVPFSAFGSDQGVRFRASPRIAEAFASKVRLTRGRGEIVSGESGGVEVRDFSALVHGGRASANAQVSTEGAYSADVRVANASLAGTLSDLEAEPEQQRSTRAETGARIGGRVTVAGVVGDPSTLQGRGDFSVRGGTVVQMPLTLALIRAGHFQVPTTQTLDDASLQFYIEGDTMTFESISLTSGSVSLFGFGTIALAEQELDLRFITRSGTRLPIISDVVEGLRDELVTATVRGTLSERVVGTEQFGVSRRLLRELFDLDVSREQALFEESRSRVGEASLDRWRWEAARDGVAPVDPERTRDAVSTPREEEGEPELAEGGAR